MKKRGGDPAARAVRAAGAASLRAFTERDLDAAHRTRGRGEWLGGLAVAHCGVLERVTSTRWLRSRCRMRLTA
jgi:hypothetical protein